MAVAVNIFVSNTDPSPAPLSGVTVNVYDPDDFTLITSAVTDSNGQAAFLLPGSSTPGTSYEVRFYKLGCTFQNPQTIQVLEPVSPPQTNDFDFSGTPFSFNPPSDPRVCRCVGTFVDFANRPVANAMVRIMANAESGFQNPKVVDSNLVSPSSAEFHTDSNGRLSVDLFRTGHYYITFSGEDETVWDLTVPDRSTANLVDLIHPQPVTLNWDSSVQPSYTVSVSVGQTITVPLSVTFSDFETVQEDLDRWITITNSDGLIADVGLTSTANSAFVSITGVRVGTVTLTTTANQVLPKRVPIYSITAPVLTINVIP